MSLPKENHQLTKQEILSLIKQGKKLDESGDHYYVLKFAFNDKWNQAVDPRPFRIKTDFIDNLAADMIGTPFTVPEYGKSKHIRGTDFGKNDTAKDLLENQTRYAIGPIVEYIKFPSNNIWAIIDVWPEFRGAIDNNLIPPLTSPTINIIKEDSDGIEEAQFLNLQAVPSSGYPAELTQITGVCKKGIKQCMQELSVLGAAGKLEASRKDPKLFSLRFSQILGAAMSQEGEITLGQVAKTVEDHGKAISDLNDKVGQIGTDVASIKTSIEGKGQAPASQGDKPPAGAAGEGQQTQQTTQTQEKLEIPKDLENNDFAKKMVEQYNNLLKDHQGLKKSIEDEKNKQAEVLRKKHSESIVNQLITKGIIKKEDKEKKIKEYFEMKNEDGTLKDLELLDNTLKSMNTENKDDQPPTGAYGQFTIPEVTGDRDSVPKYSNTDIIESVEVR